MDARLGLIAVLIWSVSFCPRVLMNRAQAEEPLTKATREKSPADGNLDDDRPSIAIQDQSPRLLSPGFCLAPLASDAAGKLLSKRHHDSARLLDKLSPFDSNEPLLIDAETSRVVSRQASDDRSIACKYCGLDHPPQVDRVATSSQSEQTCDDRKNCNESPAQRPKESRTVQEIVDLMESLGPGILEGSVFTPSGIDGNDERGEQPAVRKTVVQNLRILDAQNADNREHLVLQSNDETVSTDPESSNPWYETDASGLPQVGAQANPEDFHRIETRIDALRSSAEQLDGVANQLERRDLYFQSDQLRELASQLRADARNARIALMSQPVSDTEPRAPESLAAPFEPGPITHNGHDPFQARLEQLLEAMRSERRILRR